MSPLSTKALCIARSRTPYGCLAEYAGMFCDNLNKPLLRREVCEEERYQPRVYHVFGVTASPLFEFFFMR